MNIFKDYKLNFWQIGLFKISLISLGILIGINFANIFNAFILVLWILFLGVIVVFLGFFEKLFFVSGILIFTFPYFLIMAKSIEKVCLIKRIKTKDLQEGDWLNKNLKIGRELIKSNWEGLSEKDISKIKKKFKEIEIKQGIPFVPVFLISFLVLMLINYLWNSFW